MKRRPALGRAEVAVATLLCLAAGAAPAAAAPASEVIEGQHVRIVSTADPSTMGSMLPGDVAVWDVSISAEAPEPGQIDIGLSGDGELPLIVDVRSCVEPWSGNGCASDERSLARDLTAPLDGTLLPMLDMPADAAAHLRLDVSVPPTSSPPEQAATTLRVHADGFGDELEATPPDGAELPRTGMQLGGAALLAIGAVVIGIAGARLLTPRRHRTRS